MPNNISSSVFLVLVLFVVIPGVVFGEQSAPPPVVSQSVAILSRVSQDTLMLGLELPLGDMPIERQESNGDELLFVYLEGRFLAKDWTLTYQLNQVPLDGAGRFRLQIPLQNVASRVEFLAVGPYGETRSEVYVISVSESILAVSPGRQIYKTETSLLQFAWNMGLGFSFISYSDPRVSDYSEKSLVWKGGYTYLLPRGVTLGVSSYFTALPISASPKTSVRFLGINARVGYVVPSFVYPWRLSVLAGAYYTTMFVAGDAFGFKNMMGPQIYPVLVRFFDNGRLVSVYAKFSPVGGGFSLLGFSNYEFAGGGSFAWILTNGHPLSVTLDVASLQLLFPEQNNAKAQSNSFSVGAAYGF